VIVDHQAHWHPREYFERLLGRTSTPFVRRWQESGYSLHYSGGRVEYFTDKHVELDLHLADMDEHGIDVVKLSPSIIGEAAELDSDDAVASTRWLNQQLAAAQRQHPDRIHALAVLPMRQPDRALAVLDEAVTELGMHGVCVFSNSDGMVTTGRSHLKIFQRIEELGVPMYLHPAAASCLRALSVTRTMERGFAWMVDTSIAAMTLIESGVLEECPNLVVVHPHAGGTIPYVAGRLLGSSARSRARGVPDGTRHDLAGTLRSRFYVDSVTETPGALAMAADLYGPGRVLFATDYPWLPRRQMLDHLATVGTPLRDEILSNAIRTAVTDSQPSR
jgi:predicted TIM-barrel fold metal-dependent hydrolase